MFGTLISDEDARKRFYRQCGVWVSSSHDLSIADKFVDAGKEAARPDGCITDALARRGILYIHLQNNETYSECMRAGFFHGLGIM